MEQLEAKMSLGRNYRFPFAPCEEIESARKMIRILGRGSSSISPKLELSLTCPWI
jgi:hypothetical protein